MISIFLGLWTSPFEALRNLPFLRNLSHINYLTFRLSLVLSIKSITKVQYQKQKKFRNELYTHLYLISYIFCFSQCCPTPAQLCPLTSFVPSFLFRICFPNDLCYSHLFCHLFSCSHLFFCGHLFCPILLQPPNGLRDSPSESSSTCQSPTAASKSEVDSL